MRNLKRALSLALASVMVLGMTVVGTGASYTDVTSKQNQEAIEVLQAVGIMVGDDNGNFNPDQKVTRNEMAVVMSNLMDYRAATYAGTSPFTDVPSWAEPYVAACWTNGITSGYTKTTYGGSDTVTTSQAALMLMKALGYFQYQSDFGSDWQFATVKQANKIDLFDDVDSGVREAMTRNDLAQLVLNALETPTVEAEKDGQDIEVNGVTITSNVKYLYITSSKDYAEAINKDMYSTNTDGTKLGNNTVELGEKLYNGDLKKKSDDSDDFKRPASTWTYKSSEIGTYADDVDGEWTAKVTNKALYDAVGSTAYDKYTWEVYRNGEPVTGKQTAAEVFNITKTTKTSSERVLTTGDGVLTQVYVDDSGNGKVVLSMIDTGVAKVTKVTENSGEYEVTVAFKTKPEGQTNIDTKFTTDTKFAKDDIVVYTAANKEIQTMEKAKTVSGKVTAQANKDYTTLDGTKYGYNYAYKDNGVQKGLYNLEDSKKDDNPVLDKDATLYLDSYGYAVAFEGKSSTAEDYLYVKAVDTSYDDVSAKVVFYDGTQKTIDIDKVNEGDAKDGRGQTPTTANNYVTPGYVYKYSAGSSDYDLTFVDNIKATSKTENGKTVYGGVISNKTPAIVDNKCTASTDDDKTIITADSQTVYVDVENNKTWTGYKNVSNKSDAGIAAIKNSDNVAEIVFIYGDFSSAANDDDFVVLKSTDWESAKDSDKKTVYRFVDAYDVKGQLIDNFQVTENAKNTIIANGKGLYLVKDYDNDYAKSMVVCQKLEGNTTSGAAASVYAESAKNGVLTLNTPIDLDKGSKPDKQTFAYNDKTTFIVIDQKADYKVDTIRVGDYSDIVAKADAEDDLSDLTGVYVITVDNDDDTTPLATSVLVIVPYVR